MWTSLTSPGIYSTMALPRLNHNLPLQGRPTNGPVTNRDFDVELVKKYFKLIQATHHLTILNTALENNTFPIGIVLQSFEIDLLNSELNSVLTNPMMMAIGLCSQHQWHNRHFLKEYPNLKDQHKNNQNNNQRKRVQTVRRSSSV